MLITFESGECGGKDTQLEMLRLRLLKEGKSVSPIYWEPGSTLKSEVIRLVIKNQHNSDFVFPGDFKATFDLEKYKQNFEDERLPYHATRYLHNALVLMDKSKNDLKHEMINFVIYNEFEEEGKLAGLITKLNNRPSPKGTPAELLLSRYLSPEKLSAESQLYLYMAARNIMYHNILNQAVLNYDFVLLNRSVDSSTVYQGHAQNPGLIPKIRQLNKEATEGIVPDITFLLDLEIDEVNARKKIRDTEAKYVGITKDFFDEKELAFHEKIRQGYLAEAKYFGSLPETDAEYNRIKVIDAKGSKEEVHERLWNCLNGKLQKN